MYEVIHLVPRMISFVRLWGNEENRVVVIVHDQAEECSAMLQQDSRTRLGSFGASISSCGTRKHLLIAENKSFR